MGLVAGLPVAVLFLEAFSGSGFVVFVDFLPPRRGDVGVGLLVVTRLFLRLGLINLLGRYKRPLRFPCVSSCSRWVCPRGSLFSPYLQGVPARSFRFLLKMCLLCLCSGSFPSSMRWFRSRCVPRRLRYI